MKYALIDNGVVINMIVIGANNLYEFPTAIPIEGLAVQIGDEYSDLDERFYHNEEPIYSIEEQNQQLQENGEVVST